MAPIFLASEDPKVYDYREKPWLYLILYLLLLFGAKCALQLSFGVRPAIGASLHLRLLLLSVSWGHAQCELYLSSGWGAAVEGLQPCVKHTWRNVGLSASVLSHTT